MDDEHPSAGHSQALADFCNITGAAPHVAEHYLSAYNYDVNRAIEFFLENPPDAVSHGAAAGGPDAVEARRAAPIDEEAYAFEDHDYAPRLQEAAGQAYAAPAARAGPPQQPRAMYMDDEDDAELQRVLAESSLAAGAAVAGTARASGAGAGAAPRRQMAVDDDDEELPGADEELAVLGRHREQGMRAALEAQEHVEEMMQQMLAAGGGLLPSLFPGVEGFAFGQQGAPAPARARGGRPGMPPPPMAARRAADAPPAEQQPALRAHGGGVEEEMELPEGFSRHDLEEARMMEAALLGVPYQGRLPNFSAAAGAGPGPGGGFGAPLDPALAEHRELRWDQDRAYEESLKADRAKAEAAARAQAAAEAAERAQREAAEAAERAQREATEAAARAAAEEEARRTALVAAKAARLPAEPQASDADALMVVVRMPDGSRQSRRFRKSDPLSAVFDFLDVQMAGSSGDGGSGGVRPGGYSLVTQFPRRTFNEGATGTFADAGVAEGGGAAFFLEPKQQQQQQQG